MGVQSLNPDILKYLGRIHSENDAIDNYKDARNAGFTNINLDMMFGIPGQTEEIWYEDFKQIIGLRPEHISFYSLQVEEGTSIFSDVVENRVRELDTITDRRMYHDAIDQLEASGYHHYEISNAALPGFESKHNLKYWSMKDYLGVGLGAHSFISGRRYGNTDILKDYLSTDRREGVTVSEELISKGEQMSEYIFLGLRKTEGIDLEDFELTYGEKFLDLFKHETDGLIERGLVIIENGNLKLTQLGLDLSNQVFVEYI
jgi:oxygen-independent coproporphyrinogen-3 oxidase